MIYNDKLASGNLLVPPFLILNSLPVSIVFGIFISGKLIYNLFGKFYFVDAFCLQFVVELKTIN